MRRSTVSRRSRRRSRGASSESRDGDRAAAAFYRPRVPPGLSKKIPSVTVFYRKSGARRPLGSSGRRRPLPGRVMINALLMTLALVTAGPTGPAKGWNAMTSSSHGRRAQKRERDADRVTQHEARKPASPTNTKRTPSPASMSTSFRESLSFHRSRSTTPGPGGRASGSRSLRRTSSRKAVSPPASSAPRSAPPTPTRTWATCSRTVPLRRGCATA